MDTEHFGIQLKLVEPDSKILADFWQTTLEISLQSVIALHTLTPVRIWTYPSAIQLWLTAVVNHVPSSLFALFAARNNYLTT